MYWFLFFFGCGFFLFDCGWCFFGVIGIFLEFFCCVVFFELVLFLLCILFGGVFILVLVFVGIFLLMILFDFFGVGVVVVFFDVVFFIGGFILEVNNVVLFVVVIGLLLFFGSSLMRFNMLVDGFLNFCSVFIGFFLVVFCFFRNIIFWKNVVFVGSVFFFCCLFEVFGGEFCFVMFFGFKLFEFLL